jgi:phospholipid/cholesterol/gamma-HCH transport system permease protein
MITRMTSLQKLLRSSWPPVPLPGGLSGLARWSRTWWHIVHLGALCGVLLGTPSTWRAPLRQHLSYHLWHSSAPLLLGYGLMSTLLSLVIMRIVLVTAQSYGLSQYALEMVVRVLVLELIPLTAAMFVALKVALPAAVDLAELRHRDGLQALRARGVDVLRQEIVPRVGGLLFSVLLLASLSSIICLVLAYLLAHGLSPWALDSYTRLVGRIFSPAVTLIFVLKLAAMAAAASVIPIGSALHDPNLRPGSAPAVGVELQGLVRLFSALLLIELASLAGNYA